MGNSPSLSFQGNPTHPSARKKTSQSSSSMVSLLYDLTDWEYQKTMSRRLRIPSPTNPGSLLPEQQQPPTTITESAFLNNTTPVSIGYGIGYPESDISLSDDSDDDNDSSLSQRSSNHSALSTTSESDDECGSLRFYGQQRLGSRVIRKRPTGRYVRLQETHRLDMLKRRLCDLEARNQCLRLKESALEAQRDAVATREYEDRQRVRQLEEQLAALKQALLTSTTTEK